MTLSHSAFNQSMHRTHILLVAIVTTLLLCVAMASNPAQADLSEDPQNVSQMNAGVSALQNTASNFSISARFCSSEEKYPREAQLDELRQIAQMRLDGTNALNDQVTVLEARPIGAHYTQEAQGLRQIRATLRTILQIIRRKATQLAAVPVQDCTAATSTTSIAVGQPGGVTSNPLEGVHIHVPNFYPVSMNMTQGPVCTEAEKWDIIVAVARERANAGHNMNQADQVIWSIWAALRTVTSRDGQNALNAMMSAAQAQLQGWISVLDAMDIIYEQAQQLEVVDCDETDGRVGMIGSDTDQSHYASALDGAMQANPQQGGQSVSYGHTNGGELHVLHDAQAGSEGAIRQLRIERRYRDHHHRREDRRNNDHTSSNDSPDQSSDLGG